MKTRTPYQTAKANALQELRSQTEDKRKSVPEYYATRRGISIGPVLDYTSLNTFLLGFRKAMQVNGLLPNDTF